MGNDTMKPLSRKWISKDAVINFDQEKIVMKDDDEKIITLYFLDEIKEGCHKIFVSYITQNIDADVYVYCNDKKICAITSQPKKTIYYSKKIAVPTFDKFLGTTVEDALLRATTENTL